MLSDLRKSFNRRHLTDPSFGFLFDEDASGEVVVLAVGATSFEPAQAELLETHGHCDPGQPPAHQLKAPPEGW